jgi:hypothetical protein
MVSGSNPNPDFTVDGQYPTEYRTQLFYPLYYNARRPQPQGLLPSYTYGGPYFDISLDKEDLFQNASNAAQAKVVIIRPGFSTHCIVGVGIAFSANERLTPSLEHGATICPTK